MVIGADCMGFRPADHSCAARKVFAIDFISAKIRATVPKRKRPSQPCRVP